MGGPEMALHTFARSNRRRSRARSERPARLT